VVHGAWLCTLTVLSPHSDALRVQEDDIESILAALAAEDAKKTAVTVTPVERPPVRGNQSTVVTPTGDVVM